jgi:FKBP-type peptidyl-prolyl cis-trans isomerase
MSRATHRLALLALAAGTSLAGGCDSAPSTCQTGQIQIVELEVGSGAIATDSSRVSLTYTGRLEDGREVANESELTVTLSETAPPGFRQGVAGMRENGRRRFTLPPNLGFGPDGGPVGIPACARLIFTVELHEVLPVGCSNNAPNVTIEDPVVGSGAEAVGTSRVTVNSTLSLLNGTIIETRSNAQFLLTDASVLAGIRQGIVGMRVGGQRRVFIPPNLGYGLAGLPTQGVPGCATLVYDVELIAVEP